MPLVLQKKAWVYAERLYLHVYRVEGFLNLLKQHEIQYPGEPYEAFKRRAGQYPFMSEEDYTFANFMEHQPTYKYLPLLRDILFDEEVLRTRIDSWNYYGEYIRAWVPTLIDLIKLAGIKIDDANKKLIYEEDRSKEEGGGTIDFLNYPFGDMFLDYIRKEANECFRQRQYLAVMFLTRKILESVVVRVMEVVFPKLRNGRYDEANHGLWYDKSRNRRQDFGVLLDNLKDNAKAFQEDGELVLGLVAFITPLKDETNRCVHDDYKVPTEDYVRSWKIPHIMGMANRVYRKYCNP